MNVYNINILCEPEMCQQFIFIRE